MANLYAAIGETHKALELNNKALEIRRKIGDRRGEIYSLLNLGGDYECLGNTIMSIEVQKKALSLSQELGDKDTEIALLGSLGIIYTALADHDKAMQYFKILEMLTHEVERHDVWYNIGVIYLEAGDHKNALDSLTKAIQLAPKVGRLYRSRASALIRLRQWREAKQDPLKAETLEPFHPFLDVRKGELDFWQQKFQDAISHFKDALSKFDSPELYFSLGLALSCADNEFEAEKYFKIGVNHTFGKVISSSIIRDLELARDILVETDKLKKILDDLISKIKKYH